MALAVIGIARNHIDVAHRYIVEYKVAAIIGAPLNACGLHQGIGYRRTVDEQEPT